MGEADRDPVAESVGDVVAETDGLLEGETVAELDGVRVGTPSPRKTHFNKSLLNTKLGRQLTGGPL